MEETGAIVMREPVTERVFMLLLFNTTRARAWSPDPQARGSLSLWTGAWPFMLVLYNTTRRVRARESQVKSS